MLAIDRRKRQLSVPRVADVPWKTQIVWLCLLVCAQFSDVWTTAFGLTHGTVEGNWLVAAALDHGGMTLFWVLKLTVAAAMTLAVIIVRRFAHLYPGRRAYFMQQLALRGTQLGAVSLFLVTVNNLVVTGLIPIWPAS
jgi:hypothetical protein